MLSLKARYTSRDLSTLAREILVAFPNDLRQEREFLYFEYWGRYSTNNLYMPIWRIDKTHVLNCIKIGESEVGGTGSHHMDKPYS